MVPIAGSSTPSRANCRLGRAERKRGTAEMIASTFDSYPSLTSALRHESMRRGEAAGGASLSPRDERLARVARRHDERRLDHFAAGQLDAPHSLALAEDAGDARVRAQRASGGDEGSEDARRHRSTAADRPSGVPDVLHRVGQRAQTRARRER